MEPQIFEALRQADLKIEGEFLWGSNSTFFLSASWNEKQFQVVYKPVRGEQPLWDFPPRTLAKREVAAYLVNEALGWELVPPTIFRQEAPFGPGMVQLYIDHDPNYHYFTFSEQDRQRLQPVVLLDLLINNADRKGSHILVDSESQIRCIDHGVSFHVEDKLRTVIWDFAGQLIPQNYLDDVEHFHFELSKPSGVKEELEHYLTKAEIRALIKRTEQILNTPYFPYPPQDRRSFPYPLI